MLEGDDRSAGNQLYRFAWTIYLLLAIGGAIWIGFQRDGLRLEQLVDPARWWRDVLWGLAAAAVLLGLWEIGRRILPAARELERTLADLLSGLEPDQALGLAVVSGFAEELFFRGAVQGQWGLWIAALLFALLHSGPGRAFSLWSAFAAVAGVVFGLLTWHTGNLLAPILAHILVNALNLSRLVRRTPDPPEPSRSSPPEDLRH